MVVLQRLWCRSSISSVRMCLTVSASGLDKVFRQEEEGAHQCQHVGCSETNEGRLSADAILVKYLKEIRLETRDTVCSYSGK